MTFGSTDLRGGRRSPQQLLETASWRRRNSLWLLGPVLGVGMVTWASFLYVGRKARRWDWIVAGCVYAIGTAVGFYYSGEGEAPSWHGGFLVILWVAGLVHAVLSNRAWLRWRAENSAPWYAQQSPPAFASSRAVPAAPTGYAPLGVDPSQFYAPRPAPPATPPYAAPAPSFATPPPAPVDVNRATEAELLRLPGMTPDRAQRVVSARADRRGFGSVEEFAAAAGLAPHEHARLRPWVTCSGAPMASPQPGSGRIVDF